jgi:hypothetical protein
MTRMELATTTESNVVMSRSSTGDGMARRVERPEMMPVSLVHRPKPKLNGMTDFHPVVVPSASSVPDIVVVGFGDSGTRGVKQTLQNLGVRMCGNVSNSGDNRYAIEENHEFIEGLLKSGQGRANSMSSYRTSANFEAAVNAELTTAHRTKNCIKSTERQLAHGVTRVRGIPSCCQ